MKWRKRDPTTRGEKK